MNKKHTYPSRYIAQLIKETRKFIKALDSGASSRQLGLIKDNFRETYGDPREINMEEYRRNSNNNMENSGRA